MLAMTAPDIIRSALWGPSMIRKVLQVSDALNSARHRGMGRDDNMAGTVIRAQATTEASLSATVRSS